MRSLPFSILMAAILSALMLYFTGLIPAIGEWYSYDQSFRLQTQAFVRGDLALQQVPHGHRHDWAWGNGIQQIWGLGVPIIQLPFEIIANLFGFFGFPDRLIFLTFYLLVASVLWKSLNCSIDPSFSNKEQLTRRLQNIPILLFAMLNPASITMMRAKFGPYEEAIAYGYLWALLLFALIYLFLNNHNHYLYLLTSTLAGFSPNIRPTIGAYGFITFLLVFYIAIRYRIRYRWSGLLAFSLGALFLLATNNLRFNNPLEFGHSLLLSGTAGVGYLLKFDNTMYGVPFYRATLELLSALFFITPENFGFNHELLWHTDAFRMREFNFKPYDSLTLVILALAWIIVGINILISRRKGLKLESLLFFICIWSISSFFILFLFYSRTPAITSRYLVDFGPAIVIGITALYLCFLELGGHPFKLLNIILCTFFLGWFFFCFISIKSMDIYTWISKIELTNVTNPRIAQEKLLQMKLQAGPDIPSAYNCNDRETKYGIPDNNAGWDISASCMISLVTTHFLDNPKCLSNKH